MRHGERRGHGTAFYIFSCLVLGAAFSPSSFTLRIPIRIMNHRVDRHGCIDFRIEGWANIHFDRRKEHSDIEGVSVNCLLNGLFLLNGYREDLKVLPGEIECWDNIIETIYINLLSFFTVYELFARVRVVVIQYLSTRHAGASGSGSHQQQQREFDTNFLYGATTFIFTWVANFNTYISDSQLLLIRSSIAELGALGIADIVDTSTSGFCVGDLYRRLVVLLDVVTAERTRRIQGFAAPLAMSSHCHHHLQLLARGDEEPKIGYVVPSEQFEYLYHDHKFQGHSSAMAQPYIAKLEGSWDKAAAHTSAKGGASPSNPAGSNKTSSSSIGGGGGATPKIGVFGGRDLLNQLEDDRDSDNSGSDDDDDDDSVRLETRIPWGTSLIQSVLNFNDSTDTKGRKDIWFFDSLELARQWTLIDHALFCAIPMCLLLVPRWSEPRNSMAAVPIRKFIDRFNAMSLWTTSTVLSQETPDGRAQRYSQIITLMSHLLELHNYNGTMALLTGLQQGCVARLKKTISLVPKRSREKLAEIQVIVWSCFQSTQNNSHCVERNLLRNCVPETTLAIKKLRCVSRYFRQSNSKTGRKCAVERSVACYKLLRPNAWLILFSFILFCLRRRLFHWLAR
jgi:RasGEF domain